MRSQRGSEKMVGQLVNLARSGELDMVAGSLSLMIYSGFGSRDRLRQILATLVEATGTMVRARAAALGLSGVISADLRRPDQSEVDIDVITPPMRATIRALLAEVNGCPADAADQVALAVAGDDRSTVDVIVLALGWTAEAVDSCAGCGVSPPQWLLENLEST